MLTQAIIFEDFLLPDSQTIADYFTNDDDGLENLGSHTSLDDNEQAWEVSCAERHRAF